MTHVFEIPERPAVPITGSNATFPVLRIFCIGRNYAAHARGMGKDPTREPPFFFTKFADAAVPRGGQLPFPSETSNSHYEAQLVMATAKEGALISNAATPGLALGFEYRLG